MANSIKYSEGSESLALNKGNWWIGTGDSNKGPTAESGYWNAINPPSGGYTVYLNKETNGPSIHSITSDENLISFTNKISGNNYTTVAECLVYYQTQDDKLCVNREYENIVTDGLVLNLDAGYVPSYPTSGTTWYDLSGGGNDGSLVNGTIFSGGSMVFDGVDDYVDCGNIDQFGFTNGVFSISVWLTIPSTWTGGSQYPNLVSKGANAGWDTNGWSMYIFRNRGTGTGYAIGVGLRNDSLTNTGNETRNLPTDVPINAVATIAGIDSQISIYINGINKVSRTQTVNPASNTNSLLISRGPNSNWFPGKVYTTKLYNRALTPSEVLQNYNAQKGRFGL